MSSFKLPDLGEGLHEAHLVEWHVKAGQTVELDQLVVSVETAKAIVDIPAPAKSVIQELHGQPGDTLKVGEILFTYEEPSSQLDSTNKHESVSVVGDLNQAKDAAQNAFELGTPICMQTYKSSKERKSNPERKKALSITPRTMAFARKLGLAESLNEDILNRSILNEELNLSMLLERYQAGLSKELSREPSDSSNTQKLSETQRVMSEVLSNAHKTVVPTSLFDDAEVTHWKDKTDITVNLIQALVKACRLVPIFNAHFDPTKERFTLHKNVNLGLAISSAKGLFVPVLKQIEKLSAKELRHKIDELKDKIAKQTIKPAELQGATISLSNIGSKTGKYATPIIVPPQVAILAVGKKRKQVVVREDEIRVGDVIPLSLSFDHRLITGEEAAMFMNAIITELESEMQ